MESRHRRLAAQLASQLPDDREDARKTVEFLKILVEQFLYQDTRPKLHLATTDRDQP